MKSCLRGDVLRQASPISRFGSGAGKRNRRMSLRSMHLARDRHLRQQRDAIAVGDHLHDGGEARRAEAVARLRRQHVAIGQRLVAQAMSLFEQKQPLVRSMSAFA